MKWRGRPARDTTLSELAGETPTPRLMKKRLTQLGSRSVVTAAQIARPASILESFPNPRPNRDYEIKFVFPEFTSVCPVTGQPDFATITVAYVPDKTCVEMKSLKLYYNAFRNEGAFYEEVVNTILDDLVKLLNPRTMTVVGEFNVRGGTAGIVTATHGGKRRAKGRSRG